MIKLYRPPHPTFYKEPPKERTTLIQRVEIERDAVTPIPEGTKWMIIESVEKAEIGYGYGPNQDYAEVSFHTDEHPNPNIEQENKAYQEAWSRHQLEIEEWEQAMKVIDKQEDLKNRALLAELKAKYELKTEDS